MKILIENNQNIVEVTKDIISLVEKVIEASLRYENFNKKSEISVAFVDNKQIQELNKAYRNIDSPTDVLSFPLVDFNNDKDDPYVYDGEFLVLGDIVISLEKAKEQANSYGHSLEREIGFLCVHSVLHLLGYDHNNEQNTKIMREKEEAILKNMNLFR